MRITLTEHTWERLLDLLLAPRGDVERVAFLDGVVHSDSAVVTTVSVPRATLAWGYYDISADQMSEAGKHLRRYGLQRLAQVHTHGGAWVGHSERDDLLSYSHDEGAVSIVVPFHAQWRPALLECGVHVYRDGTWTELARHEFDEVLRLVPSVISLRRATDTARPRRWWRLRRPGFSG